MFQPTDIIHGIKATGSDGLSFASQYTRGKRIDYAAAIGQTVEVDAAPYDADQCAAGLHFSLRAIDCCRALGRMNPRPWRFFEVAVAVEDIAWPKPSEIIGVDKLRARRIYVVREISHEEAFGFDLTARPKRCREIAGTFAAISWLKPTRAVTNAEVAALVTTWRERLATYMAPGKEIPSAVRLVRTREEAHAAAAAAAVADADAAADAAAVDAAAAAVAVADADAAADAAAVDAAAAAVDAAWRPSWLWWYVRPYWVLRRHAWWSFAQGDDPFAPLVELYRLGCMPIGYVRGEFVVWVPEPAAKEQP